MKTQAPETGSNDEIYRICRPHSTMHLEPSTDAQASSECLFGERVKKLETHQDWLLARCLHDNYQGFVHRDTLEIARNHSVPDFRVGTRSTLLFSEPDIKSPVRLRIPFLSQIKLTDLSDESEQFNDDMVQHFARTSDGLFIRRDHLHPLTSPVETDILSLAKSHFLGAPYVWGGRSPAGLDCSGLIQALAISQCLTLPRDSHQQEMSIRQSVNLSAVQAGDLVFWPGHVGILSSATQIVHATAYSLSCIEEPLEDVIRRAGPVSSVRRLF